MAAQGTADHFGRRATEPGSKAGGSERVSSRTRRAIFGAQARFNRRESTFQHKLLSVALEAYRVVEISKSKLKEVASELEVLNEEVRTLLGGIEAESESAKEGVRIPR